MATPLTPPDPNENIDWDEQIQHSREYYDTLKASDMDSSVFMPKPETGAPMSGSASSMKVVGDVANMIFGDEMGALGMQVDQKGFDWHLERAKDFWAEHPVRATLGLVNTVAPFVGLAARGARSMRIAGISDDMLAASFGYDDVTDLARMSEKDKELLKFNLDHVDRYNKRIASVEQNGIENASLLDKAYYYGTKWFHNSYHQATDPKQAFSVAAEWRKQTAPLFAKDGELAKHLADLPPDDIAPQLGKYLVDPTAIDQIPERWQPHAMAYVDALKGRQSSMLQEGMITPAEASSVGDFWFNTSRVGSARDYGDTTTLIDKTAEGGLRYLKVPKTSSPNLLGRMTSKEELRTLVEKQSARELLSAGKPKEALKILEGNEGYADARRLIQDNEIGKATKLLSTEGQIDFTPKAITFDSIFTQGLLHESFRFMRDIAMDERVTKPKSYWAALSSGARKNWMNLDDLPGSDRIRRMVAVSKGLDPDAVEELGWVPKNVFAQVKELADGSFQGGATDILKLATAIHKTAKTGLNFPTHVSNVLGNVALLVNAGVNPVSPEFGELAGKSAGVIWNFFRNKRGKAIDQAFESAGFLESKVGKGTIGIADEFASPELQDLLEFRTMMSNDATMEGLGAIASIAKNKSLVGWMAKGVNKLADKSKVIPALSDAYMAEDAVPKMAYFLNLRQRGFSRAAAAMEVGRRMPMYSGVGAFTQSARGWALPWVTFGTEMMRVLKNNMHDYPFRTAMMLQMPHLAQVGAYGLAGAMGQGMTAQGILEKRQQLAAYADRPSTIITPVSDKNGDLRAMTLDFLPYTSVMPPSVADNAPFLQTLPMGLDDPMPIIMGLGYALTGKNSWGNDIPTDPSKPSQKIKMMALNTLGFLMPPIIDRYLIDPENASFGYKFLQETGNRVNPYTEKAGDPTFDFFVNQFSGIKMYASSPEQQMANENFVKGELGTYRGMLSRHWQAMLKSGDTDGAAEKMQAIAQTFVQEYKDPAIAHRKLIGWMKSHVGSLREHPQLKNFDKQELLYMLKQSEESGAQARTRAQQERIEMFRRELRRRGRQSGGGMANPYMPTGGGGLMGGAGGGGGLMGGGGGGGLL